MCWWPNNLISHLILIYEQQIENCLAINILQNVFFYVPQKNKSHNGLEWLQGTWSFSYCDI